MMADRVKLFDEVQEPDLSRFQPRVTPSSAPAIDQIRDVSAAAGFPNRDAVRPESIRAVAPVSQRHYYRTGRDTQFNTKVKAETKAAFIAIATEDAVPLGKVLEEALEALMRERGANKG